MTLLFSPLFISNARRVTAGLQGGAVFLTEVFLSPVEQMNWNTFEEGASHPSFLGCSTANGYTVTAFASLQIKFIANGFALASTRL